MSRFRAYPLLLSVVISCAVKNRRKGNINVRRIILRTPSLPHERRELNRLTGQEGKEETAFVYIFFCVTNAGPENRQISLRK